MKRKILSTLLVVVILLISINSNPLEILAAKVDFNTKNVPILEWNKSYTASELNINYDNKKQFYKISLSKTSDISVVLENKALLAKEAAYWDFFGYWGCMNIELLSKKQLPVMYTNAMYHQSETLPYKSEMGWLYELANDEEATDKKATDESYTQRTMNYKSLPKGDYYLCIAFGGMYNSQAEKATLTTYQKNAAIDSVKAIDWKLNKNERSITCKWKKVKNAKKYEVFAYTYVASIRKKSKVAVVSKNSYIYKFTDSMAKKSRGKRVDLYVRPVNGKIKGPWTFLDIGQGIECYFW